MKKKFIGLVFVVATVCVVAYRYTVARSIPSRPGGPEVCRKVPAAQLECNSEAAMIQKAHRVCAKACPTREQWKKYCREGRFECEGDCELLKADGKSKKEIRACKQECAKRGAECKASYRNKKQCQQACKKAYQKNMNEFDKRWIGQVGR